MGRDFYCAFPYDLPSLPALRRIRRSPGGRDMLLAYYELRLAVGQGYQYGQHVTVEDVLAMAPDWGMDEGGAAAMLKELAGAGLVSSELLEGGVVSMEDVAARQQYLEAQERNGRQGGRPRKNAGDGAGS